MTRTRRAIRARDPSTRCGGAPGATAYTPSGRVVGNVLDGAPLSDGLAAHPAFRLLLVVGPADGAEAQLHHLLRHSVLVDRGGDPMDQHVQQFDRVVVERIAILVGAHELDAGFGEGGAVGASLVEGGGRQVDRLDDFDGRQVHARRGLATGRGGGGGARLEQVLREGLDLDPVRVLVVPGLALDGIDGEECVLHVWVSLFRSSVRLRSPHERPATVYGPPRWAAAPLQRRDLRPSMLRSRYDFLALAGSSATSRSETDSSSSWKCGLMKATAR